MAWPNNPKILCAPRASAPPRELFLLLLIPQLNHSTHRITNGLAE
jgi:hypothetical protein